MIRLQNQVPSIYTSASRDFQYLSWLFNIVLNSVKHNVDVTYNLPYIDGNTKLTELLAMTLGFKVKRNYDEKQLTALVSILPTILKYKGTKKAVRMAAEALVKATGSLGEATVEQNGTEIIVTLPKDLADITLFLDLLDYILPAGMTCHIQRENIVSSGLTTKLMYGDTVEVLVADDVSWTQLEPDIFESEGLSKLYNAGNATGVPDFTSNILKAANSLVLNAGLMDNNIIPVLADSKIIEVPDSDNSVTLYSTEGKNADGTLKTAPIVVAGNVQLKAKKIKQEL